METLGILRDIITDIDVSDLPIKYIAAASYQDEYNDEQVVHGIEEIQKLMERSYQYQGVDKINLLLDFRQIAIDIAIETTKLFDNIYSACGIEGSGPNV